MTETAPELYGFVVYGDDGAILRWGQAMDDAVYLQAKDGEGVLVVPVGDVAAIDDLTQEIRDGVIVERAGQPEPALLASTPMPVLTATQFITALATAPWSFITALEAVEIATKGTMPFDAEAALVWLPPSEQLALRVALARAPIIERSHPLVVLFASTRDKTAAEMDAFFSFASTLGG